MNENAREAAYLALLAARRDEKFIIDSLNEWRQRVQPSSRDYHLAQQLAYGASQMALALDFLAAQSTTQKKISLKVKERALLHIALYQFYFLERVPLYAIADEMVKLAKKYCHSTFANFLNAILRNPSSLEKLPKGDSLQDLSIRYSYPEYFVKCLVNEYGLSEAKKIMEAGNSQSKITVRVRPNAPKQLPEFLHLIVETPCRVAQLTDYSALDDVAKSPHYYIQNITPATLIYNLRDELDTPKRILDLCASPGGKLVALHDLFPASSLYANDVSEEKLQLIRENCSKYNIDAKLSCGLGEQYSSDQPFDLIVLDVPCSNTGVLNKRPEARWRLSEASLEELEKVQLRLIEHAITLLTHKGQLWYMTCSILKSENEKFVAKTCKQFGLKIIKEQLILPNHDGWDGGYACKIHVNL